MSNITVVIIVLVTAVASFFLGRASIKVVRDKELEAKRSRLQGIRDELLEMADGLSRREEELRSNWQAMVVNASEVEALVNGSDDAWTAEDDRFLESWASAERVAEAEE